jgi:hypothetical protein
MRLRFGLALLLPVTVGCGQSDAEGKKQQSATDAAPDTVIFGSGGFVAETGGRNRRCRNRRVGGRSRGRRWFIRRRRRWIGRRDLHLGRRLPSAQSFLRRRARRLRRVFERQSLPARSDVRSFRPRVQVRVHDERRLQRSASLLRHPTRRMRRVPRRRKLLHREQTRLRIEDSHLRRMCRKRRLPMPPPRPSPLLHHDQRVHLRLAGLPLRL